MSDEHNARFMGCTGHRLVRTPHLDALAAGGTRFSAAYCNSPICVPARAAFATGRYVHSIGYWDNAIAYDGRVPGWGHALQAARIRVESIGKLHYRSGRDATGFDRQIEPMHIHGGIGQVWGSVRDPLPLERPAPPMLGEMGAGESSYNRYDRRVADAACRWLGEADRERRPWCLFVGLVAPHFPLVVPERYLAPYPPGRMPAPKLHPKDGHERHPWVELFDAYTRVEHGWSNDHRRLATALYMGLCTFMDEQVGRILAALEANGLAGNTLVVYTSDHGDNVGARGLWGKSTLYEEAAAVPLVLAGPGVPCGHTARTPVSLVDLHPTILEALGLPPDDSLPGRSLLRLAGAPYDASRLAFSEYHAIGSASGAFMLRQDRWKYHYYVGFEPELFDLEADPDETANLGSAPDHAARRAALEAALRRICDPEAVDRAAKRDQAALVARFGGRDRALSIGAPGATPAPGEAHE